MDKGMDGWLDAWQVKRYSILIITIKTVLYIESLHKTIQLIIHVL